MEHKGHRERLKARFLETGFLGFSQHEVLELLLFYAIPRVDTNPIAHRLIEKFGSLSGVFEASLPSLKEVEGIGDSAACLLKMIPYIARLYEEDKNSVGLILTEPETIARFIIPKFIGKTNEHILVICLDQKGKLLASKFLSEGSIDKVNVNIREIAKFALEVQASNIILAHNHTQGLALPSNADIVATEALIKALKPLSVTVFDHYIVARDDCVSMKQSGIFSML